MDKAKSTQEISQLDVNTALYLAALQTVRINKINQWEKTIFKASTDTTTDFLEITVTQHDDQIYVVTHMAAVDNDKSPTTIRLFSVKAGQKHIQTQDKPSSSGVSINWDGELITSTGQKLRAEFWNTDTDDKLYFTVSGYWVPK